MFESNLLSQINTASPLPTLVEVSLVNSLNKSLSKAFQFAHLLLAEKCDVAARFLSWNAEIWLVLQSLMEYRLLFYANTTFAEMLFGLRRGSIASPSKQHASQGRLSWWIRGPLPVPSLEEKALQTPYAAANTAVNAFSDAAPPQQHDELTAGEMRAAQGASYGHLRFSPISNTQRCVTLFLITAKPYLDELVAKWYTRQTDSSPEVVVMRTAYANRYPIRARIKKLLTRLYPIFYTVSGGLRLLYQILFLLELTPYIAPFHRVFGIALRRLTMDDELAAANPRARRALLLARVFLILLFVGFRLLELTGAGSAAGGGSALTLTGSGGEEFATPPPPVLGEDVVVPSGTTLPQPGICPVCGRRVTNAAVCTISGVVGCYPCLTDHTRTHGACPLTKRKTTVDCIRRIYEC
ncbi:peroxisome assembly protein [Trypanosoma rangeli]|uniref:Peroxisome assembly protein n=1 Tax=Trypanosoma rangeli TaxID=5698 RepID=A0A422NUP5_TRYRA|nr:peroxisome assembly protein [Trypanosoma rangeli]RNF09169.1 peroxisome assembly protein [Trypanosoma rangeli]|eukprot:RNF09169.1 peroxisome assembly protein [Trypanosoma rangeli]